jgi:glyceraldehyde 3-phosphate dehydrogenase
MTTKVAINGFGRIGRLVARAIAESKRKDMEVVGINDLAPVDVNAHLFRYDSVHGRFPGTVTTEGDIMDFGRGPIRVTAERDPSKLPWKELGVDIALECTGIFADKDKASAHLTAGAKRVLISAPAGGVDKTIVFGVNDDTLTADDIVVSNASCTTNCLAPVAKVLHDKFGIVNGFMTTIHAYTNDQNVLDQAHSDPYRARAAAQNMIPTPRPARPVRLGLCCPIFRASLMASPCACPPPMSRWSI